MSGVEQKLRILAIHGYRQSDSVFRGKLGSLRKSFKQKIDFIFIRAPHLVPSLESSNNEGDDESIAQAGYGWWFNTEDCIFKATEPSNLCVGFHDSVALIEKTFHDLGPFDGIAGFSQGAAFVAILCAMQQKQLISIKFGFAMLISGFKSLCKPHEIYYDLPIQLPTLHVYGEGDRIIPIAMARELSDIFENRRIITHEGGHYVPGKKQIYVDFIEEMFISKHATLQQ